MVFARHNEPVILTLTSISLGGARLAGVITVAVGERIRILFELEGQQVDLDAEVVRVQMVDMSSEHIAARFIALDSDSTELVRRMVQRSIGE